MAQRVSIFLCVFFLLNGCLPKTRIPEQIQGRGNTPLVQAALQAWQNKDYASSAKLYQRLLVTKSLPARQIPTAWQRMTYSALYTDNYMMARTGVLGWAVDVPKAKQDPQWLQAKFLVNTGFAPDEQQEAVKDFLLGQNLAWHKKAGVIDFVSSRLWQKKNYPQSLAFSRLLYAFSPAREQKLLQERMISSLRALSLPELLQLEPQEVKIFPDNCLAAILALRQLAEDKSNNRRLAYEDLRALSHSASWQGGFPFQRELEQFKKEFGRSKQEIALLLPLSGGYANLSQKILQGIEIGLQFLFKDDFDTQVRIINSEAQDWMEQIQALPSSVAFIGGPLRKQIWKKIVEKRLNQRYAFFTFLSRMQEEGESGWRFFSSPNDQVRSLIKVCKTQHPDMRFAILYPEEPYGKKMSKIFSDELEKNDLELKATWAYPPGKHRTWGKVVTKLLGIQQEEEKEEVAEEETTNMAPNADKEKESQPDLEAVFLPDSFAAARQLIPAFFYNDAGNLLFLGPQLWEERLANKSENKYFSNTLFPSAWWRKNPSYPARFLDEMLGETRADFWSALGFDFIRFLSRLHPDAGPCQPDQINRILQRQAPKMNWTLAPLVWDPKGRVKQEMYIFRASSRQTAPLSPETGPKIKRFR